MFIFFEKKDDKSLSLNLAKVELLKGLQKLSDIYLNFDSKHMLEFPYSLRQDYSVNVIPVSSSEIVVAVYSGNSLVVQGAYLKMDPKRLPYLENSPSENAEAAVSKIFPQLEQYTEIYTKFATSLPCNLTLAKTVLLHLPIKLSEWQQTQLTKKIGMIVYKRVEKEGKNSKDLPSFKVVNESNDIIEFNTSSKLVVEGEWLKQLILTLPVQIIRAHAKRLYPVVNGATLDVFKMKFGKNEEAVTKVSTEITFGPLTSVILAHEQNVKVVASIGRTSTGKSFLLNHLTGTLFYVDAGRCTEGVWVSAREVTCNCELCGGSKSLFVSIDVEGLASLTRSVQEDALLAQFTFALSSLVILNQREKAMDRELRDTLIKLTSGMRVTKSGEVQNFVYGDDNLFKATFIIALKDINQQETKDLLRQSAREVHSCKNSSAELEKLFQTSVQSVALPYQQREEYYWKLKMGLFPLLRDKSNCCFSSGCQFYLKFATVLSSLALSSAQPLRIQYQEAAKVFFEKHIEEAEKTGNMKLRNPGFTVPDYLHGRLCILPLISDVKILPVDTATQLDGYQCSGYFKNHILYVKSSTVPDEQAQEISVTESSGVIEIETVPVSADEKGIKKIEVLSANSIMGKHNVSIVQIPGEPDYCLKIERADDSDFEDQIFYIKDSDIKVDNTSDERIQTLIFSVKSILESVFQRDGFNEQSWFLTITSLIQAIIERRQWRLKVWVRMLAEEVGIPAECLSEEVRVTERLRKLDTLKQLCGNRCNQQRCHFRCLLPHTMPVVTPCSCLNRCHHCTSKCFLACTDSNGNPKLCSLGAGHDTVNGIESKCEKEPIHKCDSKEHYCQALCSVSTCRNPCKNMYGHDSPHKCPESHPCENHCSAPFCSSPCKFRIDEVHDFCLCSQEYCTRPCEMPRCNEQCSIKDHFHSASETLVYHFCSNCHECPIACSHKGLCEIIQIRDQVKRHFQVVKGVTEEQVVTIQKAQRHQCGKLIPEVENDSCQPEHNKTHVCDKSHQCTVRCPMCQYFCQNRVTDNGDHPEQKHNTYHGEMIGAYYVSKDINSTFPVKGGFAGSSDIAFNQRCDMFCLEFPGQGRGHRHLCHEVPDIGFAKQTSVEPVYCPDDRERKKIVSHEEFWKSIDFEDPYPEKCIKMFSNCNHQCRICETFCSGTLNHLPMDTITQSKGRGHLTSDGHHFSCNHPTHVIMVFDRSKSMRATDIIPEPTTGCASSLNNRLGTVLESSLLILQSLSTSDTELSLILFSSTADVLFERKTTRAAIENIQSTLKNGNVALKRGTSFNAALSESQRLLKKYAGVHEYTVLLFLSDGKPEKGFEVDLGLIDKLTQVAYQKLTFYAIHCASTRVGNTLLEWVHHSAVGNILEKMVNRFGNGSQRFHCKDRMEMRQHFRTVADQIKQHYHILPKVQGFDPKIAMIDNRKRSKYHSAPSIEMLQSFHSYQEVRNTFLRKTHPDAVYEECHGRKILIFSNEKTEWKFLIRDAKQHHKMELLEVKADTDDAAQQLCCMKLSRPCLLLLRKLNKMTNDVEASLQQLSFHLENDCKCRTVLVGIVHVTELAQLTPSVVNKFDVSIHIPLPSRKDRLQILNHVGKVRDRKVEELLSSTHGLSFLQMKDLAQEIDYDGNQTGKVLHNAERLSQNGRANYRRVANFLMLAERFYKAKACFENEIKGNKDMTKEVLKRLINEDTVSTMIGILDQILSSEPSKRLCIVFIGLDGHVGKLLAKIIARFLDRQIKELKYIFSVGMVVADRDVRPQCDDIAYTEDLSLLRTFTKHGSPHNYLMIATISNDSAEELKSLTETEIKRVKFSSLELSTRRSYLNDYIHNTFKATELSLNKEQDLYWLAYNMPDSSHRDLETVVQHAFLKSCDELVNAEFYRPLLFEKSEKPDYVCCKAMDYGAKPIASLPEDAKLKPPPLNVQYLASALKEMRRVNFMNGKILSQQDLKSTQFSSEGGVIEAQDQILSAKIIIRPNTIANNEEFWLSLTPLSLVCFSPKLTETVNYKEILTSPVVNVGPLGCQFDAPVGLVLSVSPNRESTCSHFKLMHSPTAFGKPTKWKCVLKMKQSMENLETRHGEDINFSTEEGSIETTKPGGLWAWVGQIPLQTCTIGVELSSKGPVKNGNICTVLVVLSTKDKVSVTFNLVFL